MIRSTFHSKRTAIILTIIALILPACTASHHRSEVQDTSTDRVTVGTVQQEIKVGMSSAAVIAALGSPNMISTDDQRRENWVYDKIATDTAYSSSNSGISSLILGMRSGAASRSQRTLTIVIKFDGDKRVRDFSYHTSRF